MRHSGCSDTSQFAGRTATCGTAYNIINMHLQNRLSGRRPAQLYIFIPGEPVVGKSKAVQTVTGHFGRLSRVRAILVKRAYTEIAASAIDGKTLHFIAMVTLNSAKQFARSIKVLELYWHDKHYLIINKILMVSHNLFAKLSNIIGQSKVGQLVSSEEPFRRLNVILISSISFHLWHQERPHLCTLHGIPLKTLPSQCSDANFTSSLTLSFD